MWCTCKSFRSIHVQYLWGFNFDFLTFFLYPVWIVWGGVWVCKCLNVCPCETDTHGNSRESSADEKRHVPVVMLRLSGSVFVPLTHCHHSHRAFPDPLSHSKLLSGAVHGLALLGFEHIWVVSTHQSEMYWNPRADFQLTVIKAFPLLEPINKQQHDQEFV